MTSLPTTPMQRTECPTVPCDVSGLSASAVMVTPRHFDFGEGYGDRWTYTDATECSACGTKLLVRGGEEEHRDLDPESPCRGYVSGDGPMMNYLYALPTMPDDTEIVEALSDLPLCVVTLHDSIDGEDTFLALTGGGMDMSWWIIAAYVRLGYLPPAFFFPPAFAGMRATDERRLLIDACRETQRHLASESARTIRRLDELERRLA